MVRYLDIFFDLHNIFKGFVVLVLTGKDPLCDLLI